MKARFVGWLLALAACCPTIARAIEVRYTLTPLHDDVFRYDYLIRNDGSLGAGVALRSLDLLFDAASFEESTLTLVGTPSDAAWSPSFLNSAPGVPAAFDLYAIGAGLAQGQTLDGFAVQFRWLGAGSPTAQGYEVYDPVTFDLLQTGLTVLAPVPEPSTLGLLLVGAVALVTRVRRRVVL